VHGTILDEKGTKMSKSLGNVVDPSVQLDKYGASPLRYYLALGLSTHGDSAYSEKDLVNIWNTEVVGGFGNLIARTLHLIDIKEVQVNGFPISGAYLEQRVKRSFELHQAFKGNDFYRVRLLLNEWVGWLNARINDERPFDDSVDNRKQVIAEIHGDLVCLSKFYGVLLKDERIESALSQSKKVILFQKLEVKDAVPY